jgi:hypothetical protein
LPALREAITTHMQRAQQSLVQDMQAADQRKPPGGNEGGSGESRV